MDRTHTRVQARGAPSEGTGLCRIPWNVRSSRGAPVAEGGSREGEQHKAQQVSSELAASSKAFPPGAFWAKITPGHSPCALSLRQGPRALKFPWKLEGIGVLLLE